MTSPLDDLERALADAIAAGQIDAALEQLIRFVANVNSLPTAAGTVLESADLDEGCRRCGELIQPGGFEAGDIDPTPETQVYVATELYALGGHSGVLRDFIAAQPDRQHHILLTDIRGNMDRETLGGIFAGGVHLHLPEEGATLGARASWLLDALRHFIQSRVFLFTHHEDAVAISAANASAHPRLHFYHHADYSLSLGVHLPNSTHIDLSAHSLRNCRDKLGIPNCIYVPLTSAAATARDPESFTRSPEDADFVTCSAANGGKFERPYFFPYADAVAKILANTGGKHVHIGNLSDAYRQRISDSLSAAEIDPDRFHYAGPVPDLGAAMSEFDVSLYISSFPIGGAKAAIDIMGSGTPLLCHSHLFDPYLGTQDYVYPEASIWRMPDELAAAISDANPAWQQEQSHHARAFWEIHHQPSILKRVLGGDQIERSNDPPAQRPYQSDALRQAMVTAGSKGDFATLFSRIGGLERRLSKALAANEKATARAAKLEARSTAQKEELTGIKSSLAWKLAGPFHRIARNIRKRRKG